MQQCWSCVDLKETFHTQYQYWSTKKCPKMVKGHIPLNVGTENLKWLFILYNYNKNNFALFTGLVFFTIRWWDPAFFEAMHPEGTIRRASWPYVEGGKSYLWTWLFLVPLFAYSLWQALYYIIVNVLRRQRLLRDPEVMTSYRYVFCHVTFSLIYS